MVWRRVTALIVGLVGLCGLILWFQVEAARAALAARSPDLVVGAEAATYPAGFEAKITRIIAFHPLAQADLNHLYIYRQTHRAGPAAMARLRAALAASGWQNNAAQQNLIAWSIESGRLDKLFLHSESLLSRNKLVEPILQLFYLIESLPAERRQLVATLAKDPEWRGRFLTAGAGLSSPAQVAARASTIDALLARGAVSRSEISPLLSKQVELGQTAQAYALWTKFRKGQVGGGILFDPSFRLAASNTESTQAEIPFEWQLASGSGSSASFTKRGAAPQLELYWNGQGVPVFLRQYFSARRSNYRLRLLGVEADAATRDALRAMIVCNVGSTVAMRAVNSAKEGEQVFFVTERPVPCSFPELRIYGQSSGSVVDFTMRLSHVDLMPIS